MIGSHPKVKGGITSVISQLLSYDWNEKGIVMKFLPSYSYNNNIMKILFFIFVYFKIIFHFIFFRPDICHMHMSYKGSFQRKYIIQRLCLFFKIKNIIHLHGSEFEKYYNNSHEKNKLKINKILK